jgi:hypothetical protein
MTGHTPVRDYCAPQTCGSQCLVAGAGDSNRRSLFSLCSLETVRKSSRFPDGQADESRRRNFSERSFGNHRVENLLATRVFPELRERKEGRQFKSLSLHQRGSANRRSLSRSKVALYQRHEIPNCEDWICTQFRGGAEAGVELLDFLAEPAVVRTKPTQRIQ